DVLAAAPALAARLLRYRDGLDQVGTLVERLRAEVGASRRDHSNSLVLSPRDPREDRAAEASPLVCMQLRRQLGRLHAASVLIGEAAPRFVGLLLDLQRAIATVAGLPVGSAFVARVVSGGRTIIGEIRS